MDPLVLAARELLAEWAEAEGPEGLLPFSSFARAYSRLPAAEQADLDELAELVLATAPESAAKLATFDGLRTRER
ncbi:MAG: hypothetical protein WKF94_04340 [Solirubrobacteraceae bacterium]